MADLKIYTRTGDRGTTALHGAMRVPKTDIRIEANGSLDELNVAIGIARSFMDDNSPWQAELKQIQLTLMTVMSRVATVSSKRDENPNALPPTMVEDVEILIDRINQLCGKPEYFLLPGGNKSSAFLHQARVAARRAERRLWQLNELDPVEPAVLCWVNRLSDLFFVMARHELMTDNREPEHWQLFSYKRTRK